MLLVFRLYESFEKTRRKTNRFCFAYLNSGHIFTPEEIGKMTTQEFTQNESIITSKFFSRKDIGAMSTKEYTDNVK